MEEKITENKAEANITELIKGAIKATSERFKDESIVTAEDMIPHMRTVLTDKDYPKKYIEDIQYADSEDAKLDIYFPAEGEGPYPVFVEIHGGAWYFGQKSSIEFKPFLHGLKRGYACVSVGYTLSPKAIYPQAVIEIKKAIDFIKKNADKYNLDKDRIVLWGGSAGAHLAALAAYSTDTGYLDERHELDSSVNVLVLWYGCFNYYLGKKLEHWVYQNFYGVQDLGEAVEAVVLSNPGCHVTENAPFTLLQHGLNDGLVPYEQSVYMYDIIKTIAGEDRCMLDLVESCDHADAKLFADDNVKKMFDIIEEKLK